MAQSRSPAAYQAERKLLNDALTSPTGIRIKYPELSPDDAKRRLECLRRNLYSVRKRQIILNNEIYPEDDPRAGTSEYDALEIRLTTHEETWCLEIVNSEAKLAEIEVTQMEN